MNKRTSKFKKNQKEDIIQKLFKKYPDTNDDSAFEFFNGVKVIYLNHRQWNELDKCTKPKTRPKIVPITKLHLRGVPVLCRLYAKSI